MSRSSASWCTPRTEGAGLASRHRTDPRPRLRLFPGRRPLGWCFRALVPRIMQLCVDWWSSVRRSRADPRSWTSPTAPLGLICRAPGPGFGRRSCNYGRMRAAERRPPGAWPERPPRRPRAAARATANPFLADPRRRRAPTGSGPAEAVVCLRTRSHEDDSAEPRQPVCASPRRPPDGRRRRPAKAPAARARSGRVW